MLTSSQLLNIYQHTAVWRESIDVMFSKSSNSFEVCIFIFYIIEDETILSAMKDHEGIIKYLKYRKHIYVPKHTESCFPHI